MTNNLCPFLGHSRRRVPPPPVPLPRAGSLWPAQRVFYVTSPIYLKRKCFCLIHSDLSE